MSEELRLDEDRHEYWLGKRRLPSVSEIIKPVCSFDGVPVEILERKSEIGKATHLLAQWYDEKQKIDRKSIDDAVAPYFEAWKKFCREMKPVWFDIEQKRFHHAHRYAGTLDRYGVLRGMSDDAEWMVDIKTVATVSPATGLQTAAYASMREAEYVRALGAPQRQSVTRRAAVQLKNDGTYRFVEFSDPNDWPTFLSLLTLWKWRSKHNII